MSSVFPILNVSQLTRVVRELLEGAIGEVWVEGEISNFRKQASGHQYFTLKDERSQISCVLFFRPGLRYQTIPLSDGMQVQVRGTLTVYEARGQYQINVQQVQVAGAGLLQAKFEALKRRLADEGLFDPAHKKEIPRFPQRIGIVTSPTGAAIRDMLNILHRRAPWLPIVIWPARVQGEGAAQEIAEGVRKFNRREETGLPPVDVIIVCRGGGSIEDLWAFNEEVLARTIFDSEIPVISAVGHEIDFTISDFVADLRAPTPSAAAELAAPDSQTTLQWLVESETRLQMRAKQRLQSAWQQVDFASELLTRGSLRRLQWIAHRLERWSGLIRQYRPDKLIATRQRELKTMQLLLTDRVKRQMDRKAISLATKADLLRVMSPQAVMERGYSITLKESGEVIKRSTMVSAGEKIRTRFSDGEIRSRVEQ